MMISDFTTAMPRTARKRYYNGNIFVDKVR
jgi:hypothetical protein